MAEEVNIAAEAVQAAEAAGVLGTLGINWKIFVAQLLNFALVLIVLWKFAYDPIVKRLEERRELVETGLKKAEEADVRLSRLEDERKDIMKEAKLEAVKIIDEARVDAEKRGAEMIDQAKREVERIVVKGKGQLQTEKEAMIRDARKEIVQIAMAAAQKVLQESVDERKSVSMAEEVVRKMT